MCYLKQFITIDAIPPRKSVAVCVLPGFLAPLYLFRVNLPIVLGDNVTPQSEKKKITLTSSLNCQKRLVCWLPLPSSTSRDDGIRLLLLLTALTSWSSLCTTPPPCVLKPLISLCSQASYLHRALKGPFSPLHLCFLHTLPHLQVPQYLFRKGGLNKKLDPNLVPQTVP